MDDPRVADWLVPPPSPELRAGEVHVWRAHTDGGTERADVLAADELAHAARFRFDRDRERWVAARVLLRTVLGRVLWVPPAAVALESPGRRERPVLRHPADATWLRFSLAHSGDVALVATARDQDVGVDVEQLGPERHDLVAIARRVLGPAVAEELDAACAPERAARFYRAWTRHEARGKCLGSGLVEPEQDDLDAVVDIVDLDVDVGYAGALAARGAVGRIYRWCVTV